MTTAGLRRGAAAVAAVSLAVVPLGATWGLTTVQAGLGLGTTLFISATVFAGAAQFAALELWQNGAPLVAIWSATFAVNARMLLYGASLYPWLGTSPALERFGIITLLSDANWAASMSAAERGERDVAGVLFGGGLLLWTAWMIGTALGVVFARELAHPERFGFDVLLGAFLWALLTGSWRGRVDLLPWAAAAVGALASYWWLPPNWHVIVGAIVGAAAGMARDALR